MLLRMKEEEIIPKILKWKVEVLKEYSFFNLKWITLLVLNNATTHMIGKTKDKIKKCEIVLPVILSGKIWRQQQYH